MAALTALSLAKLDVVVAVAALEPNLATTQLVTDATHKVVVSPLLAVDATHQLVAIRIFVVLGVPAILVVLMLAASFLSGLLSQVEQEQELEWWARGGAVCWPSF